MVCTHITTDIDPDFQQYLRAIKIQLTSCKDVNICKNNIEEINE